MPLMGELLFSRLWGWCCSIAMGNQRQKKSDGFIHKKEVRIFD